MDNLINGELTELGGPARGGGGGPMSPVWILKRLVSVFINACHSYCQLCRHYRNLAEGGCLLSRFHFWRCRYFLGHVACQNLPWQGLY